jgi:hypothetical protein
MDLLSLPFVLMVITASSTDPVQLQPPPLTGPPQPVVTHGTLGKTTVRHYIRLHLPAIRFCYVQELGKRPNLSQKVAVRFTIEPTGHVTGCSAGGVTPLERCVARAVGQLRFPAVYNLLQNGQQVLSSGRTAVTYRFNFKPAKRARPGAAPPPPVRVAATPQRSGPRLPPSATSPRPTGTTAPTARSASSRPLSAARPASPHATSQPATSQPATSHPATSQPSRPGAPGGAPRKPKIEAHPSDDPLGGLDLSKRR